MGWNFKIIMLLAVVFISYSFFGTEEKSLQNFSAISSKDPIIVYMAPGYDVDPMAEQMKIRGMGSTLVQISDVGTLDEKVSRNEMKEASIIDGLDSINFPFYKVSGKLYSLENFQKHLQSITPTNVKEKKENYVVVYGPSDCTKTSRVMDQLNSDGISFEYRDVNDPNVQPRFKALTRAFFPNGSEWPVVDVSGTFMSHPSADEVKTQLNSSSP